MLLSLQLTKGLFVVFKRSTIKRYFTNFFLKGKKDEKINCLSEYYQEALYKIEVDLNKMKTDPNMACYAVIEEFRDQVVVRGREVKKEWRKFIRRQKAEIWPDVYQKQAQFEKVQRALAALNSF